MLTDLTEVDKFVKFFYEQQVKYDDIDEESRSEGLRITGLGELGIEEVVKRCTGIFVVKFKEDELIEEDYQIGIFAAFEEVIKRRFRDISHEAILEALKVHEGKHLYNCTDWDVIGLDLYVANRGGEQKLIAVFPKPGPNATEGLITGHINPLVVCTLQRYGFDEAYALDDGRGDQASFARRT